MMRWSRQSMKWRVYIMVELDRLQFRVALINMKTYTELIIRIIMKEGMSWIFSETMKHESRKHAPIGGCNAFWQQDRIQ